MTGTKQLGGADMPEWLLHEVLLRLPVKYVFRSKLVSKQWLSIISDPFFVRMFVSRASMSPHSQPWTLISANMHVDDSRSWSLYYQQTGTIVLPCPCTDHPKGKDYAIIGVSNGLVLYNVNKNNTDFYICNPITEKFITIPPHTTTNYSRISIGFLTRVEDNILTSYRIVRLHHLSRNEKFECNVFNSDIGKWEDFNVPWTRELRVPGRRKPAVLNGILHWVTTNRGIIAYDPFYKPCSLDFINLPHDIDQFCNDYAYEGIPSLLDVHQERLRYFETSHDYSGFRVWLLNDYRTAGEYWSLQHKVSVEGIVNRDIIYDRWTFPTYLPIPISFHPFDSDIVYLGYTKSFGRGSIRYEDRLVSYNIMTKEMQDHGCSLHNIGDIAGKTRFPNYKGLPCWWLTSMFMIPPWPIYIPPPSFNTEIVKN